MALQRGRARLLKLPSLMALAYMTQDGEKAARGREHIGRVATRRAIVWGAVTLHMEASACVAIERKRLQQT